MRRGMVLTLALVLGLVAFSVAVARVSRETSTTSQSASRWPNTVFWSDDMEGSVSGWSTVDNTAFVTPHFHVDTYMAFAGHSWWCGNFDYDVDGGYGNNWDDRLNIPATDWTGATYPLLEFECRYDSETDYDFTYVQAESSGVFVNLNRGYTDVKDWTIQDFYLGNMDNPAVCRFRFVSDGGYSDEDGNWLSVGGGFMCDDVKIYDYTTGDVFFLDDVESGGLCTPATSGIVAGDYWHVVVDVCSSYSPTHSWWCGDDADTSLIPPNLNNSLITPIVDISDALTCTLRMAIHTEVPTVDNDVWINSVSIDGGTWYSLGAWWGDFGSCNGWGSNGLNGEPLDAFLPAATVQYKITFMTTDNGCGPGVAGGAGINVDDTRFEGVDESAVEPKSWGAIKFLYR
jgi:hypothetical protein